MVYSWARYTGLQTVICCYLLYMPYLLTVAHLGLLKFLFPYGQSMSFKCYVYSLVLKTCVKWFCAH